MRAQVAVSLSAVLLAAGIGHAYAAGAQAETDAARAISTVMDYRRHYLADPIPFDACTVQRSLGGSAGYASEIVPLVRDMLDSPDPCPRPAAQGPRTIVLVDSVRASDEIASVFVTVLRGELRHREDYSLIPLRSPGKTYMGVREVRLWGSGQAHAGRRGP